MSIHIHRYDEAGFWACSEPRNMDEAVAEVDRILRVKKRLGESWSEQDAPYGYVRAWSNSKGHKIYIKED